MANIQPLKVIFHEVNSNNFWLPQHPLFVGINLSDMKKLRLKFESGTQIFDLEWETFVGTLIHSRILETGYCNNEIRMFNKLTQFINVFIVKETINVPKNYDGGVASTYQFSEDTPVVKLYVTDFFVKHYGLNLLEKFYFKPVYCLPLEKVVFLAKSDECYNWATQDNWCDKLSLSVCNPKKVLCRSGDVLLGMPKSFDIEGQPSVSKILDLIAVECQPVAQGILTINTTVVVTKFKPDDCRIVKKPQEPVISFNKMLHVFSYCNSLLPYGLLLGSVNPFSVAVHKNLLRHSNKSIFHVKMLPQLPKMYLLTKRDFSSIDPVNLIIVSDVSLKELNIVNGSWVKISMCICKDKQTKRKSWLTEDREPREDCSNYSRATKKANSYSIDIESEIRTPADKVRLVRVFSINTDDESTDFPKFDIRNNVAFISPNLWFNLNKHPSSFLESAARLNCEGMLTQEDLPEDDLEKVEISPPYANELHLSLVQSPAYTSFSDLLLLSKYFEIDRYVVKGDILAIDSREDVSFHQELENSFYTKWPVVYYRVVLVEGPPSSLGYRAKKGHTYLYTVLVVTEEIGPTLQWGYTTIYQS